MKVVCISDTEQNMINVPNVTKGRMYHVIDSYVVKDVYRKNGFIILPGKYYILAEMGNEVAYYHDMFIEVIEDQQDEATFIRNYQKETV